MVTAGNSPPPNPNPNYMNTITRSLIILSLCATALHAQTAPTQGQIWNDVWMWKQIVGDALPYVPPSKYPRPLQEFYTYKNAAQ